MCSCGTWAAGVTRPVSVGPGGAAGQRGQRRAYDLRRRPVRGLPVTASNLVAGDTNGLTDVFVRDRRTQCDPAGVGRSGRRPGQRRQLRPAISADGRYVAFCRTRRTWWPATPTTPRRVRAGPEDAVTRRVSVGPGGAQANCDSFAPAISADGRYVAFASGASNLVAGDTNGTQDVFVRDRGAGDPAGVGGSGRRPGQRRQLPPAISADGRYVAFWSRASNLVAGDTNGTSTCSCGTAGPGDPAGVGRSGRRGGQRRHQLRSGDLRHGRYVAFTSSASNLVPGDTNDVVDVFVRDRLGYPAPAR